MTTLEQISAIKNYFGVKEEHFSSYIEYDGRIIPHSTIIIPIGKTKDPSITVTPGARIIFRLFNRETFMFRAPSAGIKEVECCFSVVIPGYNDSYDESYTNRLRTKLRRLIEIGDLPPACALDYYCGKVEFCLDIDPNRLFVNGRLDVGTLSFCLGYFDGCWLNFGETV